MALKAINQASLQLLVPQTAEETYQVIVQEACKLINAFRGSLFLVSEGILKRAYSTVPAGDQFEPRPQGHVYQVFKTQKPLVISAKKLKKERQEVREDLTALFVYVPLGFGGESIGVITLELKTSKHFTPHTLAGLKLFGSFATLKIRNAHLLAEAQESVKMRDLFISMASHELKTPMTTISGYVQLLNRQVNNQESINKEWLWAVRKETLRLKGLVQELLEVDKIFKKDISYDFKKKNIKHVIRQAIDNVGFMYPSHVIVFKDHHLDQELLVTIDENKILQALINILNNAAKFSEPREAIMMNLFARKKSISIIVVDQGEGISNRDLPLILKALYHGQDTEREGMGMGLYIVKNIMDSHKGAISIKSKKNHGTQVTLRLPL